MHFPENKYVYGYLFLVAQNDGIARFFLVPGSSGPPELSRHSDVRPRDDDEGEEVLNDDEA